jgi:4-hydroxy-tetrahydrodipicolinate synthase
MSRITRRQFIAGTAASVLASKGIAGGEIVSADTNKNPKISPGVWPVMVTPFTEANGIDTAAVKELTEFYITAKMAGIFAAALTGEIFDIKIDEALEIGRAAVAQAAGRIGVVVGANFGTTLDEQAAAISRMHDLGVDAAVIVLTKLPSPDDIEGQLLKLMDKTAGPLGIYECPHPERRQVSPETVRKLGETGRFCFAKETSYNAAPCAAKAAAAKGTPFRIFSATLSILPEIIDMGADGFCGTVCDWCPELTYALCNTTDPEERKRLKRSLKATAHAVGGSAYPSSGKYVLQKRGLHLTTVSRCEGSNPFTGQMRTDLDAFLKTFDFQHGLAGA